MIGRVQPPVHSPTSSYAILHAAVAMFGEAEAQASALCSRLQEDFEASAVLLTDSGTSALALALQAVPSRAPVAMPAYSCYSLATAADMADCAVLLYDLDPYTLGPDLASLHTVVEAGAGTVVVAPLFGIPTDMKPIEAVCAQAGVVLVEDAAQHAGAMLDGSRVGTFGTLTVLSFGRGKGTVAGSGGALLGRGKEGEALVQRVGDQLAAGRAGAGDVMRLAAQWLLARPTLYSIPSSMPFLKLGETIYRPPRKPTAMSRSALGALPTAMLLAQPELSVRRRNAEVLLEALQHEPCFRPISLPRGAIPGYLRLPALQETGTRSRARERRARRLGIMPGYPRSLADLPGFKERVRNCRSAFPGSRSLAEKLFTLPTHSLLQEADMNLLLRWIED